MSKSSRVALVSLLLLAAVSAGAAFSEEKAKAPAKARVAAGKAVLMSADELKWTPMKDVPQVQMAVLWGNPEKGPHGSMMKFTAGFAAPLHFHTSNHRVFVIAGTMEMTPEGGTAKKLGPGSYFSFTGKKKHTTKCMEGAECVLAVDCAGPWDVVMAEAPAAK